MEEKLLSFDYYLSKVPMYLKQNDTFTQHFKIWYDMLISSNESFDTILNLLDIFSDDYNIKYLSGDNPVASNLLEKLANLFNIGHDFSVTYKVNNVDTTFELNLTDEELLILLKAQIIKNNFNGTYDDIKQFYNKLGWTIIYQVNVSASAILIFVGKSGSSLSENLQKCWNAGLLSVNSLGIDYAYNIINNYDTIAFWGISKWDEGEWSV